MEDLISVVWDELKRYINTVDRQDAADNLVSILIDNDIDPENIKDAFKGDSEVKKALLSYINTDDEEEIDDDEYIDDDDSDNDW